MCGRLFRKCSLLLVLLLCSPFLFSQPSVVEIDPLGIYEISGRQLIELRTERTLRETQLVALALELRMSKRGLTEVQNEWTISQRAIAELETSSMTLSELARSAELRATRYKNLSIVLGSTTAAGLLFIAFTVFGR